MARGQVTENTFKAIKAMLAGGATQAEVARYLGLSESSISRCKNADNYEGYKAFLAGVAKSMAERRKRPEADKQTEKEEKPRIVSVPWQVIQEMQHTNKLLTQISDKLAYIVEQLS